MYHTIIVGAGPAGLQCAATLAFDGLKVLLLDGGSLGGQILNSPLIENVVGRAFVPHDWATDVEQQLLTLGVQIKTNDADYHVTGLWERAKSVGVHTPAGTFAGMTVVLAHGCSPRPLPVPGADLPNVHYELHPHLDNAGDRRVLVVGGANSAGTCAMHLGNCGNGVFLLHRDDLNISQGITDLWQSVVTLQRTIVRFEQTGRTVSVHTNEGVLQNVNDVYVMAGRLPQSRFADGVVRTDTSGFVYVGGIEGTTATPGVFACGNCVRHSVRTMGAAIGAGTNTANAVWQYLRGKA